MISLMCCAIRMGKSSQVRRGRVQRPPGDDAGRQRPEEEAGNQAPPGDDAGRQRPEEEAGNQAPPGDDAGRQRPEEELGKLARPDADQPVASRMYSPIWRSDRSASGTIGAASWKS